MNRIFKLVFNSFFRSQDVNCPISAICYIFPHTGRGPRRTYLTQWRIHQRSWLSWRACWSPWSWVCWSCWVRYVCFDYLTAFLPNFLCWYPAIRIVPTHPHSTPAPQTRGRGAQKIVELEKVLPGETPVEISSAGIDPYHGQQQTHPDRVLIGWLIPSVTDVLLQFE